MSRASDEKYDIEIREMVEDPPPEPESDLSLGDRHLDPNRPLTPRHRKAAELFAQGKSNQEIAKILDYTESRVSILKSNTRIRDLAESIRERLFEDTVGGRLKKMSEPALNVIESCLTDKSNRFKENLKVETAKWVVEKLDGKAVQKYDVGENMLSVLMDRLDRINAAGQTDLSAGMIDVTPLSDDRQLSAPAPAVEETAPKIEDDLLRDFVDNFASLQK